MLAVAVAGSQAGHLVAYQLRFGGAALQVQSAGAHAYYPGVAKTAVGAAAGVVLLGLLAVGLARISTGRNLDRASVPPLIRLIAGLFTLQVAIFAAQETLEASLSGLRAGSPADLLLWGAIGQLPAAAAGAVALRWLLTRVAPAVTQVWLLVQATISAWPSTTMAAVPAGVRPVPAFDPTLDVMRFTRRGPPGLLRDSHR